MYNIFNELGLSDTGDKMNYTVPEVKEVLEPTDRAAAQCKNSCEWHETRFLNQSCKSCMFFTTNWTDEQEAQFIAWEGEQQ
jgi:hypothetical protein